MSWSAEPGYERLSRRLDAARPDGSGRLFAHWKLGGGTALLLGHPGRFGVAAGVLAALVAVAWLGVDSWNAGRPVGFTTSTDTAQSPAALLDIVFASGVTEAERRELLDELGAMIVAGPSEIGRVTVSVSEPSSTAADALIAALEADPRVRFVGRSFPPEPQ